MRLVAYACLLAGMGAFGACAYPEFHYKGESASSSKSSSAVTTTGSGGGTTTTTGGGGMMATTGGGGMAPCTVGKAGACGAGKKCTVVDAMPTCGKAGPKAIWQLCATDADCADTLWCDTAFNVCKPFCKDAGDCKFDAQGDCIQAMGADGKPVPGAMHCTSNCEPKTVKPCGDNTNCVLRKTATSTSFDCAKSGLVSSGKTCKASADCGPGSLCIDPGNAKLVCSRWCSDPGNFFSSDCGFNPCYGFDPKITYNGKEYGSC